MGMSQGQWIAAALVAGFLAYLSVKGKLPRYWSFLTGGGASQSAAKSAAASGVGGAAGSVIGAVTGSSSAPPGSAPSSSSSPPSSSSSSPFDLGTGLMPDWMPSLTPMPGVIPGFRF
jgi:hypothetical protein